MMATMTLLTTTLFSLLIGLLVVVLLRENDGVSMETAIGPNCHAKNLYFAPALSVDINNSIDMYVSFTRRSLYTLIE
jgi:hypothetical protein